MLVNPQQRKKNILFYNNICIIICIFCILCFWTASSFQNSNINQKTYHLKEDSVIGPINITNKSQIYRITAYFNGNNSSSYISGEVLDEDKDTLYEFGKDLWHESGYDSEGYWSESDRKMVANLTFSEKGIYYIKFNTEEKSMDNITITIRLQKGSYIAHLQVGTMFLLLIFIFGILLNRKWVQEKLVILNDKLEEVTDALD